ncbi:hypothetical protein [Aerosakkonema funiforme]|uniref:Uncharacterized protein n=2 Tax=Oscillatoriophycideae TaxID=1301283 RepID=A0A926ZFF1_9CYAN|nr:hypothetical protein [Aerosakkonema funiforme]MBD2180785.1 hypothetical protein [Aerosakkonema funiforme FACHB-1375]
MKHENEDRNKSEIVAQLHSGELLVVNRNKRNGLILYKSYHAEFAGPGSAVGGTFDNDCQRAIPVGNFSLVVPDSYEARQTAYKTRRQWIMLTKQLADKRDPLERAEKLLLQFEAFFDAEMVAQLPDDVLGSLVGVLPQTMALARQKD